MTSIAYVANGWQVGGPLRPFPAWSQRLADNAAIDANSAAVVADLASQSQGVNHDTLNVWSWTAEPLKVPASQPLVPVHASGMTSQITAVLAMGAPIPPGVTPTNDSDATLTIWQPDYTEAGLNGRYYELFGVSVNADGSYNARRSAARMVGCNDATRWGFADWTASGVDPKGYATDPNSTYELHSWGVQGSGLPYLPGVLTVGDCVQNYCSHTLLLEVPRAAQGLYRAPATRSDGGYQSLVQEGMQFRFPPGYQPPAALHPLAKLICQAARDFRIIVTDQAGTLAFRAAPSVGAAGYLGSAADYAVLNGFPWQDLQLLA